MKRHRPKNDKHASKKFHTKYYVPFHQDNGTLKSVQVCQAAFLGIIQVSRSRVETVIRNFMRNTESPKENRGGLRENRKAAYVRKQEAVIKFIQTFTVQEFHYCRSKTSERKYLAADLNIRKLYWLYNRQAETHNQVKKTLFYKTFNTKFNIGFGRYATDACSTCIELKSRIKYEKDPEKKAALEAQKQLHRKRKNAFFELVREKRPDMVTLCFDCEKNLPLPKIPDSITYYSRQLYLYNFTITEGCSKYVLNKETVWCYTWMEDEFQKGSNEISSALIHRLQNFTFTSHIKVLRLIADGCPGQNKNSIVITAISMWLLNHAPQTLESVELVFPITGHSFLPPDRVFGNVEQEIKKNEEIILPCEYRTIIERQGKVLQLGDDVDVYDFKATAGKITKQTSALHFKIKECRRFFIRRHKNGRNCEVRGELVYKHNVGEYKTITRKPHNFRNVKPYIIRKYEQPRVKAEKVMDVKKLLTKHFDLDWEKSAENLQYYINFFNRQVLTHEESNDCNSDCEYEED